MLTLTKQQEEAVGNYGKFSPNLRQGPAVEQPVSVQTVQIDLHLPARVNVGDLLASLREIVEWQGGRLIEGDTDMQLQLQTSPHKTKEQRCTTTVEDAARHFGVSKSTVYRWIDKNKITAIAQHPGKVRRTGYLVDLESKS